MYITKVISYNGAWEKLLSEHKDNFHELQHITSKVPTCPEYKKMEGGTFSSTVYIHYIERYFHEKLLKNQWNDFVIKPFENRNKNIISGLVKDDVVFIFELSPTLLTDFIFHKLFYIRKSSINILPILCTLTEDVINTIKYIDNYKEYKIDFRSHLDNYISHFEIVENELKDISPVPSSTPFLVFGLGFEPDNFEVIEIETKKEPIMVERCIEFPPEYHQAGLGILNYFGTVLRESYPEQNAKVKIEQDGLKVRLIVESENGDQKIIEKALHEYELVLRGETAPEDFYLSPIKALELKNQLRVFQFQVESQRDLIALQQGQIKTLTELAQAALSKPVAPITVVSNFHNTNTQNTQVNFKAELHQSHDDLEKLINLTDDESIKNRLRDIQNALDNATTRETPEEVQNSSGMKKLGNLLNEANEVGTQANGLLEKGAAAIDLLKKLGRHYNRVAEWCGLPVVPGVLVAE